MDHQLFSWPEAEISPLPCSTNHCSLVCFSPSNAYGKSLSTQKTDVPNESQALVYAIYSACLHPEFIEPLRQEAQAALYSTQPLECMPLMDAFLRESARLNPLDARKYNKCAIGPTF